MRCDFKYKPLCLPFTICLSLVLVRLAVSGWNLSLLWACKPVSVLLGYQLSSGRICAWKAVEPATWLLGANGSLKTSVLAASLIICLVRSQLLPSIEKVEISPPCSEMKALLEDHSLLVGCAQKIVELPVSPVQMAVGRLLFQMLH